MILEQQPATHNSPAVDAHPNVTFQPVAAKAGPGWCVRVAFPGGEQTYVGGFISQAGAEEWIALKSADWIALKECERKAPPCLAGPLR